MGSRLCRAGWHAGYYAWAARPPSARRWRTRRSPSRSARSMPAAVAPMAPRASTLSCAWALTCGSGAQRAARTEQRRHPRRPPTPTPRADPAGDLAATPAPDLVERRFTRRTGSAVGGRHHPAAHRPGLVYLAVALDAFSRRIAGWSMAEHLRTELVLDALDMAIAQRNPGPGLVHHRDHGCQYTAWPSAAASNRPAWSPPWAPSATRWTTPSPRASSPPWNASCWTATSGPPRAGLRTAVFDFIEVFYNRQRRHSTSTTPHPLDYEHQHPSPAPAA